MSAGGGEGDVELNIAPIIDCFTVLIAYLLVSISFISLKMLEVEVAATSIAPPPAEMVPPPESPITMSVEIEANYKIQIKLTGGPKNIEESYFVEPVTNGSYNLDGLKIKVISFKEPYPNLSEANVSAEPAVKYRSIIDVVQALKTNLKKVFLAS